MHNVVIDKPYSFVPPYQGNFLPRLLQRLVRPHLRYKFGIGQVECHGLERLQKSIASGHGVLLAPNHCRPADPFVVSEVARQAGCTPFVMASWHLFMQGRFQAWLLRRAGVFSVYREGLDKAAVSAAVDILAQGKRPLVIFPEGVINRANDRLNPLMEGTAFIARAAAKKRVKASAAAGVVVHPVAMKYRFRGDVEAALSPVLDEIEQRLSWRMQRQLTLVERINKVGEALLCLKEMEHLGQAHVGPVFERVARLIDKLLAPLEQEWLPGKSEPGPAVASDAVKGSVRTELGVVARVKKLRSAVLPDMVKGELDAAERERRWRHLADMYLAQQLSCYPPDYVKSLPSPERILETVERFEEDLTDRCRAHSPMTVSVEVGEPLAVTPDRQRGSDGDPLLADLEQQLLQGINRLGS